MAAKNEMQARAETPTMTHEEWMTEGKRRFGENFDDWKFVCPVCKHVASVGDFRKHKDNGATPDSATRQCIGRYDGSKGTAFGEKRFKNGGPCDYALYGLFRLPGVIVTGSPYADGKQMMSFAFAD
jgi:hypothetical protein